jgi:hypothetical protein
VKNGATGKHVIASQSDVAESLSLDAEVMVGKTVVYTGASGEFELTVKKKRAYEVSVEGGSFRGGD